MLKEMLGMAEGILQDLHDDHREVSRLMEEILQTEEAQRRSQLFKEMASKLLAHAQAEQRVLYRRLEEADDETARKFAYEGANEHQIVERQLEQLSRGHHTGEQWTAQMMVLRDLVEHHVEEEESTGFSCARSRFDRQALDSMGAEFRRQKEMLLNPVE